MNHSLDNRSLHFSLNSSKNTWSLTSIQPKGPGIQDARMRISYRCGMGRFTNGSDELRGEISSKEISPSRHGILEQFCLSSGPDRNGLLTTITYAVPQKHPFLLLKMRLENQGRRPIFVDRLEFLHVGFVSASSLHPSSAALAGIRGLEPGLSSGAIYTASGHGDLAFWSNGWQSWSYSGVYGAHDRFRRTRLGPLASPMRVNPGTPHPKRPGIFGSDMFGILGDRTYRTAILAGFLSQKQNFGSLEAIISSLKPALRMWANGDGARLDPGATMETDWACITFLHLDTPHPLDPFIEAVARENDVENHHARFHSMNIPVGWCSWYHFYQKVRVDDLRHNLKTAKALGQELPLRLIQLDDGFEAQVGDWFSFSPGFPDGVSPLAAEIRNAGFTPGLWLAPFIVHPRSKLAHEHPEWLLRGRLGRPVNAGFVWNTLTTALDITQPDALDYAREVVAKASGEWGYEFLKLDFLYAAALPGHYKDPTKTRAQVLRMGLEALRDAAGDETTLLGCGCPLGPAIGLVDSMRIGSDVDQRWRPAFRGISLFFEAEPDMPSARNAIQNILCRAAFHRRWWINDPDCLLVRPSLLTLPEVQSLATVIALSGGSLLLSDDLPALPPERLWIARALLPLIDQRPYVIDWFDSTTPSRLQLDLHGSIGRWHLAALFNWSDLPRDLRFSPRDFYLNDQTGYFARSFWDGQSYRLEPGQDEILFRDVPPHGCVLLGVRAINPFMPQYSGSDLHISQGLEVTSWEWNAPRSLHFQLERPGWTAGVFELALPGRPEQAYSNRKPLNWERIKENFFRFTVEFEGSASIEVVL